MKIIAFNFDKMSVEKKPKQMPEDLKINSDIQILNVAQSKAELFKSKEDFLVFSFKYALNYEPSFAYLEFEGKVILSMDSKLSKKVLKEWKDKKIPSEVQVSLFNVIIRKTSVKALELEDSLNLPYHVPMPSIKPADQEKGK